MADRDGRQDSEDGPTDWWAGTEIEIVEVGGIRVAHLPASDEAWISGLVEVPR